MGGEGSGLVIPKYKGDLQISRPVDTIHVQLVWHKDGIKFLHLQGINSPSGRAYHHDHILTIMYLRLKMNTFPYMGTWQVMHIKYMTLPTLPTKWPCSPLAGHCGQRVWPRQWDC